MSLSRDVLAVVLTGAALGVAFNALELSSRPARGLPWIGTAQPLANVDSWMSAGPSSPATAEPEETTATDEPHGEAPSASATAPSEAAAPPGLRATPTTEPPPSVETAEPADAGANTPPDVDLPTIPDIGRPLRIGLSTVSQFVAASAALVVDARDREAFEEGHLPGAVSVPYEETLRDPTPIEHLDPGGRPIIVYCSGPTCDASRMLAEAMMRDFGMHRVLVYEAGFPDWVAAGKPVERGNP